MEQLSAGHFQVYRTSYFWYEVIFVHRHRYSVFQHLSNRILYREFSFEADLWLFASAARHLIPEMTVEEGVRESPQNVSYTSSIAIRIRCPPEADQEDSKAACTLTQKQ